MLEYNVNSYDLCHQQLMQVCSAILLSVRCSSQPLRQTASESEISEDMKNLSPINWPSEIVHIMLSRCEI